MIEGDPIIRKPNNLASGLKITDQHAILHDSKPVSFRTSYADKIPSCNSTESFPTVHTNEGEQVIVFVALRNTHCLCKRINHN